MSGVLGGFHRTGGMLRESIGVRQELNLSHKLDVFHWLCKRNDHFETRELAE